ncbi:hypothetical protein IJS64_00320 [bacterium]|jgi:hypothetical protein|nr:hypothetical protein [bacterium]MBR4567202.1 hypothetical protein [bacterium]
MLSLNLENMSYIQKKLEILDKVSTNPNLNGGVISSFSLFVRISDEILKDNEFFVSKGITNEDCSDTLLKDLKSIRSEFAKLFGFELETGGLSLGSKFETLRNSVSKGPKFRKKLSDFMVSYHGKFL